MRKSTFILLFFGFLLVTSHVVRGADDDDEEEEEEEPSDVVKVTALNWEETVGKKTYSLVAFTAPWCGHCKSLKPEWAAAASTLKESMPDLLVGNVDATKEKDLATKYQVRGFPTIKFFVDGEASEYNGGRTHEEIIAWVKKRTGPPTVHAEEAKPIEEALKGTRSFVLGYFEKLEGDEYKTFETTARSFFDADIFDTTNKDVAKLLKLTKPGTVGVARKYFDEWEFVASEGHEAFKDVPEEEDGDEEEEEGAPKKEKKDTSPTGKMTSFIKQEMAKVYTPYDGDSHSKIFEGPIQHYVFVIGNKKDIGAFEKNAIKPVAKAYRGKAIITSVDIDDSATSGILNYFVGSDKPETLTVMGWEKSKGRKFKGPEKPDKKSFDKFLKELTTGKAKVFYKSEKVPEKETDDEGLTQVVGLTFEKYIGGKKDVVLEVHAPWCGHCKSFLPTYKKLAKRFAKVDSVVIAQLDGTANEHEKLDVKGFPTVLFYPAGSSTPITYEGERTIKDLTKFIKKNAKVPFELPKKGKKEEDDAPKDEL